MRADEAIFARNLGFMSAAEQERLNESTVAVAGAGGDGGMLAIQLARLGVGNIRLADPDPFEEENINRQARATQVTIGRNKAEVVGEYLTEINPDINVAVYDEGITEANVAEFVGGASLLVDETEFSLHALGVALARQARAKNVPNLMAMNIGFGTAVTTYHPGGRSLERMLGLSESDSLEQVAAQEVPVSRWLSFIPAYGDLNVFRTVAAGRKSVPSIAPGVNIASAVGASQAFLNLVHDMGNRRPQPVYAPHVMVMDAMTGESKVIKHPRLSFGIGLSRMALRHLANRSPRTDY